MNMAEQALSTRSTDIQVIAWCTVQPGTVNTEKHNQVAELVYRKGRQHGGLEPQSYVSVWLWIPYHKITYDKQAK